MVLLASKYDESRFFRADDLKNEIRLKIKNVTEEKMADGEVKLTVWFTNDKHGLVLNRTNNRTIRSAYGDDTAGWVGKIVVVFPTMVDMRTRFAQQLLEMQRVVVAKNGFLASRLPHSLDHRVMVQGIGENETVREQFRDRGNSGLIGDVS
jgi:hypothetical protein